MLPAAAPQSTRSTEVENAQPIFSFHSVLSSALDRVRSVRVWVLVAPRRAAAGRTRRGFGVLWPLGGADFVGAFSPVSPDCPLHRTCGCRPKASRRSSR